MDPILIDQYDYPLTDDRIARYPVSPRDTSKLLVYQHGQISQTRFRNIGQYLSPESLLIYNNTRVIQARLVFHKPTGARIEVFCLEPVSPHDYQLSLSATDGCAWKCMVGNLKKWKNDLLEQQIDLPDGTPCLFQARRESSAGNTHIVRFTWQTTGQTVSFAEILDIMGELPIPPYLNRKTEESDKTTYQTVYSHIKGSVAAPTAGLHFTQDLLAELRENGVQTDELTLHVGAGTFQPVKTADANQHLMHTEIIAVPRSVIVHVMNKLPHIVAVGTTSVRTLETLYHLGVQLADHPEWHGQELHLEQFAPYTERVWPTPTEALQVLVNYLDQTGQDTLHAATQIMIRPGYTYRIVSRIITNFHQPRSTLLLLVSAFVGDAAWREIYRYALDHEFRFLSYGDSSLLIP